MSEAQKPSLVKRQVGMESGVEHVVKTKVGEKSRSRNFHEGVSGLEVTYDGSIKVYAGLTI